MNVSEQIQVLWAKKGADGIPRWLPLIMHLGDTAEVGKLLWDRWLCSGAKCNIVEHLKFSVDNIDREKQARALFIFLCAAHDLGKATPAFQTKDARVCYAGTTEQSERNERDDACRDLDKAIVDRLKEYGFVCPDKIDTRHDTPHALCSQILLKKFAGKDLKNTAAILGAHHGKPQNDDPKETLTESYPLNFYAGKEGKDLWTSVQKSLCEMALAMTGCFSEYAQLPVPNQIASVELCGLLIMADWISSNEYLFPYLELENLGNIQNCIHRAEKGFKKLGLTHRWQPLNDLSFASTIGDYFMHRFTFDTPNALQKSIIELARNQKEPGIFVIEAPMGCGKTETALAAAEILAKRSGRTGVFFALPTQATSNGIFPRLTSWVENLDDSRCHSVELFHYRAEFNDDWKAIKDACEQAQVKSNFGNGRTLEPEDNDTIIVNEWFSGRKKTMLADFVVGTVDQLLMGAFKQKHVMLRHLGLANKVVIIDECHAYDAYMSVYLERILEWLGKYHIPTIVLSATLPSEKRQTFVDLYLGKKSSYSQDEADILGMDEVPPKPAWTTTRDYPIITYSDGDEITYHPIKRNDEKCSITIQQLIESEILNELESKLKDGGCAGIIVSSVRRAQEMARMCREKFGAENVELFHARFLMPERAEIEKKITEMLGKPGPNAHRPDFKIVIGTQVLEQSLDIDFDVLFTDLAPMDLLIQRMGRLHRHHRERPNAVKQPICYILKSTEDGVFNRSSVAIYDKYLLMRTNALLPEQITLPDDISQLVEDVYNENCTIEGLDGEQYDEAHANYRTKINNKRQKANAYCVSKPNTGKRGSLNGWLSCNGGDVTERAAVRDINESIEVYLVQKLADGYIHLLDKTCTPVSANETPNDDMAREILKYSMELPLAILNTHSYDELIEIFEKQTETLFLWQKSRWLKGNLFMILDEAGHFNEISDFELTYTKSEGLSYLKKEQQNA